MATKANAASERFFPEVGVDLTKLSNSTRLGIEDADVVILDVFAAVEFMISSNLLLKIYEKEIKFMKWEFMR
ncbi:MAG: hypothetical protein LBT62_07235 [Deltaproteobacteria bacterium]|nr:hypothetical protein [Deltaproteobacteria bacterium]